MGRQPDHWGVFADSLEGWAKQGIHLVTADDEDREARTSSPRPD